MKVIDYQERRAGFEDEVYIKLKHRFLWWTWTTQWRGDGVYWRDALTGVEAGWDLGCTLDSYTKMVKARARFHKDPLGI